jgi:AcrR family transcriptional regulator
MAEDDGPGRSRSAARARILDTAYALFSAFGVRAIGIDRIVAEAEVAKMTLYRYFPTKEELVLAFLAERRRRWTQDWLASAIDCAASDGKARAIALFDAFDEWFHRPDYEGCPFIRTLNEFDSGPLYEASARELEIVRELLVELAAQSGAADPQETAHQIQILMSGAIISALRGDRDAARRARPVAEQLLDPARSRPGRSPSSRSRR